MLTLHPFQEPHVAQLVDILRRRDCAADCSETGTGKSICALTIAQRLGLRPFIVAPLATLPAWRALMEEQGVDGQVATWEYIRTRTIPKEFGLIGYDEAQKAKNKKSLNAKFMVREAKGRKSLLMSATLACNPLEMGATGLLLSLFPPNGFWNWCVENSCKKDWHGGFSYKGGAAGMRRIHDRMFPHVAARLKVSEIKDFPECQTTVEVLDFGDQSKTMAAELAAIDAAALNDRDPDHPLTLLTRERQRVEVLKVPHLIEMIQDLVDEGTSVAVFANFNATLLALQARLKEPSGLFTGEHTKTREDERQRFQHGKLRVLLINSACGGSGLNCHDEHGNFPRVALILPNYSVQTLRQVLGRIHRSGSKSKARQRCLFSEAPVERRVAKVLKAKSACMDSLLDSDLVAPPEETPVKKYFKKDLVKATKVEVVFPQMNETTNVAVAVVGASTNVAPRAMKRFSPSGLKYMALSPCFESDSGGDRTAADEGTMMHLSCETGVIPDTFTEEQKSSVQMCLKYEKELVALKPVRQIVKEMYFAEISSFSPSLRGGKADLVILREDDTAEIVDYKMGRNGVDEAPVNLQVQAYVLALMTRFPKLKWVRAHLVSPRRDEISVGVFMRSQLEGLKQTLKNIVLTAERFHAEGLTSPKVTTCLWCAKRHSCPAVAGQALAIAKGYDTELKLPAEFHPSKVTDPAQMASMLDVASVMDKWVQSARHHFTEAALNGADIPNYEIRDKKASRSVDDALAAWVVAREKLTSDEFIATCSVSVPDLEKAWCKDAKRGEKGKAREDLMEKLIDAGTLKQGAPSRYLGRIKK